MRERAKETGLTDLLSMALRDLDKRRKDLTEALRLLGVDDDEDDA